jgi:hypothetical protein
VPLRKPGAIASTPTISTTGGITIGKIVIPSSSRRRPGSRRCTYTAVGSMSAMVITVVMTASRTERPSDELKPGSPTTEPKALIPANRSAAHSGSRK